MEIPANAKNHAADDDVVKVLPRKAVVQHRSLPAANATFTPDHAPIATFYEKLWAHHRPAVRIGFALYIVKSQYCPSCPVGSEINDHRCDPHAPTWTEATDHIVTSDAARPGMPGSVKRGSAYPSPCNRTGACAERGA